MNNQFDKTMYNLLLSNYPQYEKLRYELLKLVYHKYIQSPGFVDCYIDLNNFLSKLYRRPEYMYDEGYPIAASIINFAAHLKEFFRTRYNIDARLFLVYGNTRPINSVQFINEYDAHNEQDRKSKANIGEWIEENLKILDILCPYIPEVYFIRNNDTEPAIIMREMIKYQSTKQNAKHSRLIFTKDIYAYQLVSTSPNTHIIRVKKTMQGDMTYTISYFDFFKKIEAERKLRSPVMHNILPELYSLCLTINGCKDRGINSLTTYPNTIKKIQDAIMNGNILNGYNPTFAVNESSFDVFELNSSLLMLRYKALDIIYQSNLAFNLEASFNRGYVDLFDPRTMQDINNRYFLKYPLDLNVF